MLLRSSRAARHLTKEALVGRLAVGAGKGLLGSAGKHWKGLAGAGLVGITAGPQIAQGLSNAKTGLQPGYLQAANAGMVPSVPKF